MCDNKPEKLPPPPNPRTKLIQSLCENWKLRAVCWATVAQLIHRSLNYPETQSAVTWLIPNNPTVRRTPCGPPPPSCTSRPRGSPVFFYNKSPPLDSFWFIFVHLFGAKLHLNLVKPEFKSGRQRTVSLASNDQIGDLMTAWLVWEKPLPVFLRAPVPLQGLGEPGGWGWGLLWWRGPRNHNLSCGGG